MLVHLSNKIIKSNGFIMYMFIIYGCTYYIYNMDNSIATKEIECALKPCALCAPAFWKLICCISISSWLSSYCIQYTF